MNFIKKNFVNYIGKKIERFILLEIIIKLMIKGRKFEQQINEKKQLVQILLLISAVISALKIEENLIWSFLLFILFLLVYYASLNSSKLKKKIRTINYLASFSSAFFSINFAFIFTNSFSKFSNLGFYDYLIMWFVYYFGMVYVLNKILTFKEEEGKIMEKIKKMIKRNIDLIFIAIIIFVIFLVVYLNRGLIFNGSQTSNLFLYVAMPIIGATIAPFIYNWVIYRFSKPKFKVHFKPTKGTTFIEEKVQEITLKSNSKKLIWLMLHNNGKVIKDNWFINVDFEKNFEPIDIDKTEFKNVDFKKKYSIQKEKYQVAHFNSNDFSPLFPYDETFIFPIVVITPKKEGIFNVSIAVRTGNHRGTFKHNLKIKIINDK